MLHVASTTMPHFIACKETARRGATDLDDLERGLLISRHGFNINEHNHASVAGNSIEALPDKLSKHR